MNKRAFTLSLIIAGVAMFMVYTYMEGREGEFIKRYGQEKSVVIAKRDIKELEIIDDTKVTITKMPKSFLAPGYISDMKVVFNSIATVPILKGEQITKPRITLPGVRTGLSRQVSQGKRAVSINVDNAQAVTKLIKPGDRVDLLAMIDFAGGRKDLQKVKTILQDVLVLSAGINMTNAVPLVTRETPSGEKQINLNRYREYSTITLEVSPNEAQKVIFLMQSGYTPYFVLRNNDDKTKPEVKSTKIFDLLGDDAAQAKQFFESSRR